MDAAAKLLAAFSALALIAGLVDLLRARAGPMVSGVGAVTNRIAASLRKLMRGERISRRDRMHVYIALGPAGFICAGYVVDPVAGAIFSAILPWCVLRLARWRGRVLDRKIEMDIPDLCRALADMVGGGHSLRGALTEIASNWAGPLGGELRQMQIELALGVSTEKALERINARSESRLLDIFVSSLMLQRRVGGDLSRLLRDIADKAEDRARLLVEAHTASTQARFTASLVLLIPLTAVLIAQLAYPGFLAASLGSFVAIWLAGLSLVLQTIGFVVIRRMSQAPTRWL